MNTQAIGSWAFILGAIIAILAGLASAAAVGYPGAEYIPLVLVILGLIVGVVNIADKEITDFLIAAIALIAVQLSAGGLALVPYLGGYLVAIVQNIAVFVAAVVILLSLKAIYNLGRAPTITK